MSHAGQPPESARPDPARPDPEATSLDDLVADGVVVLHLLETTRAAEVPAPRQMVTIPDSAVAVVRDLDSYGD